MAGLIETLLCAPADAPLFRRGRAWVSAGDVRALAERVALPGGDGPIFLHVTSAAHFCAGLLAAVTTQRPLALPAHAQAAYLSEIGATDALATDAALAGHDAVRLLEDANIDPLLIFFTSGSTGAPKPVQKNLSRLEREARALDQLWGKDAGHVIATVSHQHIYGLLFRVVWPILSGRTSDDAAAEYWEDLEGQLAGATLVSSPAHLTRLSRRELYAEPPKLIFSSGQLLPNDAAQECKAAFRVWPNEVLGSTETGGIAWRQQTEPGAAWTPLPDVDVRRGEDGALSVRSPYLQDDARLLTGDVIEPLVDGRFRLKPRGDRVVKIDGKRVSLTRVEEALAQLPEVSAAAALTLQTRKEALAAVVALSAAGAAALKERGAFRLSRQLRSQLADALEPAERPKHWRFVDAIPTDAQGKRVLSTLRAMFDPSPLDALDLDIRTQTASEAEVAFTLPPDLLYFKGHFPGRAILPGLAEVHLAILIAQKLWNVWPSDSNLSRLKFKRVLMPDETVTLKLKWNGEIGRLSFDYKLGAQDVAQGEIGGFAR
jgi:acyl-CoA synthetase (AMP-forming)/AMP-acid ligase II/3-hydroxymyristoyl/3-hydroxydecanoyl-(acyl carrier protein) dehydratase